VDDRPLVGEASNPPAGWAGTVPGFPRLHEQYDIVVVGGGHAGLQAALKGALLLYSVALIDRGPKYSRSYYAPHMVNIPGFPNGISGHRLLDQQIAAVRAHEDRVGYITPATVTSVASAEGGFTVTFDWLKQTHAVRSRVVILAMGVVDRIPVVGGKIDPIFPWANQAIVDFCILCDGWDLVDRSVAVIGHDAFAARTVLDVLAFRPKSVELLTHGHPFLEGVPEPDRSTLASTLEHHGVPVVTGEMVGFDGIREKAFGVRFADGSQRTYDRGFSALGWYTMHATIPRTLGCRFDPDGYVVTDEDCRAISDATGEPVPGLYCIGDQRNGWNQIPEAWATAERAIVHVWASYL